MPNLLKEIEDAFGEKNLYAILNIDKAANKNEIKKAYYQLSLKVHPDRAAKNDLAAATRKFQALGKIYDVLSDADKRAIYDETGTIDDESCAGYEDRNWYDYWRILFARVKMEDIEEFEKKYKGSDEELSDLRKTYNDSKGDMDRIIDNMMCARVEADEPRFREVIQGWIDSKTVKPFAAFTCEKPEKREARKRKANAEAREVEADREKLSKNSSEVGLAALIQRNQKSRADQHEEMIAAMEEKYGGTGSKTNSRSPSSSQSASGKNKAKKSQSEKRTKSPQSSPSKKRGASASPTKRKAATQSCSASQSASRKRAKKSDSEMGTRSPGPSSPSKKRGASNSPTKSKPKPHKRAVSKPPSKPKKGAKKSPAKSSPRSRK